MEAVYIKKIYAILLIFCAALAIANTAFASEDNLNTTLNGANSTLDQHLAETNSQNNFENIKNENSVVTSSINDSKDAAIDNSNTTKQSSTNNNSDGSQSETSLQNQSYSNFEATGSSPIGTISGLWVWSTSLSSINPWDLKSKGYTDIFVFTPQGNGQELILNQFISKFQGTGIKIHAWISVFGYQGTWWPAHDTNRQNTVNQIISYVIANCPGIAGIHLDYIRYGGTAPQWDAKNYPGFSVDTITNYVASVYSMIKSKNPNLLVSAATMPDYSYMAGGENSAYYYGQDYTRLSPYLDFIVPMIYKGNFGKDTAWIGTTTAWLVSKSTTPIVTGIQTYRSDSNPAMLPSVEVKSDAEIAMSNGSQGFVLFRYGLVDANFAPNQVIHVPFATFSNQQVVDAAVQLKTYVDTNYQLPSSVSVAGKDVSMYTFLYLLTTVVQNINTNNNNPVDAISYNGPQIVKDEIHSGNMLLSEYIKIADQVKVYMDRTYVTPGYAGQTSVGPYFSYQNMIYTYSNILATYNTPKTLPNTIPIKPWAFLSDPNAATFTNQQVVDAAVQLKTYVDTNYQLPATVSVAGKDVSMYTFLYLLTTVVQNINTNNNNPVDTITYNGPQIVKDETHPGNMLLSEYIKIADQIKVYMDQTRVTPGYAYQTSLGPYLGYQSLIYMYCNVLDSYNTIKVLPSSIGVKPWKFVSDPKAITATNDQVVTAAIWVKTYVDTNYQLPATVSVAGKDVSMYTFLYLLTTVVQNINTNNNNPVDAISYNGPQIVKDEIHSGNMLLSEYIKIADQVKVYMDRTQFTPGYAYQTSLGPYFSYQNMIYTYSNILATYNTSKTLPNTIPVKPWNSFSTQQIAAAGEVTTLGTNNTTTVSFTNQQVVDAAVQLKTYVDTNYQLPATVSVAGKDVSMYTFLYLLTTVVQNINTNNNNPVDTITYNGPQIVKDETHPGNMLLSEYIKIADQIKVYMDQTRVTPGYAYQTSLGPYFSYQNMIYTYSNILATYNTPKTLPNTIPIKPWAFHFRSKDHIHQSASGGCCCAT